MFTKVYTTRPENNNQFNLNFVSLIKDIYNFFIKFL